MLYGITDLATYILGALFIVLLPGPNSLYVMSVASREGVARGYRGACGIFLGDTILMLLTASGAASLLHTVPALFMFIKYAGAAYLAWIAFGLLRAAVDMWGGRRVEESDRPDDAQAMQDPFRRALAISLMNPKAILFFVSFFIQFVDPDYAYPALSFLILGIVVQVLSALYLSALIFGGAHLAQAFRTRRRSAAVATGGVGVAFFAFCLKLATASLV